MKKPTPVTVRRQLKRLRHVIETDPDAMVKRIGYAIETAVRYVSEDTVGWPDLVTQAREEADFMKREFPQ